MGREVAEDVMATVNLSAGPLDYVDTGGNGPIVVLLHGLVMNSSVWRHVVENLRRDLRVVAPTLPLGGRARAMAGIRICLLAGSESSRPSSSRRPTFAS